MSRIGKNIKKARSEKGYTQEQLAQKLSVTRNTISNYETGHSNPDIEMLQMLAEALETDPNTLIYGEKKSNTVPSTDHCDGRDCAWNGNCVLVSKQHISGKILYIQ